MDRHQKEIIVQLDPSKVCYINFSPSFAQNALFLTRDLVELSEKYQRGTALYTTFPNFEAKNDKRTPEDPNLKSDQAATTTSTLPNTGPTYRNTVDMMMDNRFSDDIVFEKRKDVETQEKESELKIRNHTGRDVYVWWSQDSLVNVCITLAHA